MFSGSMVAIVTPMTADGGLDWPAWDRLLDFHLREGTDAIVVAGTTGESPVLVMDEIEELTRRAVARCRGKLEVIVGAGTYSTAGTVALTRTLSRLGVDAVMLVTPYYNKPPQEGLYRHFMAAADASEVPVILYNVPSRTVADLLPSTVARLARHPRIVAVKEATGSLSRARETLNECPPEFILLSGDDATATISSRHARSTPACSLYIKICSSKRARYRSSGRWQEWASSGTQSAYHWSNCRRRTKIPCCGPCRPPELPLRTKQHESGSNFDGCRCGSAHERLSLVR